MVFRAWIRNFNNMFMQFSFGITRSKSFLAVCKVRHSHEKKGCFLISIKLLEHMCFRNI